VANRRDALGRITHREETIGAATSPTTFDYTYSTEGRLTDVRMNGAAWEHYEYSTQNGNRIVGNTPQRSVSSTQTQYDAQDRLLRYGIYTYKYTNNGELNTKTDTTTSKTTTYNYDALGNLLSVTPQSGPVISYVVDGMNRRVAKKITNGGTTTIVRQWLYRDSLKPVAELDGAGNLISTFVYASSPNTPDFMFRAGKTYRILTDQIGSPRLVVNVADANEPPPFTAVYTAFGESTINGIADFLPFGFAGGMFDIDTGLVRFGARDYDPVVGRWTTKDPTLFGGKQANLYVYVGNDPVNKSDPGGLWYVDLNFTGGVWAGFTAGVFYDGATGSWHGYLGGGGTTPGAGFSANFSNGSVSPGMSSGQLACGYNTPLGIGFDGAVGSDATGARFWEGGVSLGTPGPSLSGTGYYTW
jgi:RHS repeat-associated protein